jgi:hypothetical protein
MAKAIPNSKTINNFNIILYLVIGLLILLNYVCFVIYRDSHITETYPTQLWNYLSSDLCKLITISLLLPIITLILESNFKFIQSLMENRLEREKAIRAERSQKRRDVILSTQTMLNRLFDLAIQVQHFEAGGSKKSATRTVQHSKDNSLTKIEEIIKDLEQFSVTAVDIVNEWDTLKISNEDSDMFLYFMNFVLLCAADVANYIEKTIDPDERLKLQLALSVIWNVVSYVAHQGIISMLKLHMEILELQDDQAAEDQLEKVTSDIDNYRKALAGWMQLIKSSEQSHRDRLPEIKSKAGVAFNEAFEKAREYLKQNPEKTWYDYEENQAVKDLYDKVPRMDRFVSMYKTYSKEFILYLADELGYENFINNTL